MKAATSVSVYYLTMTALPLSLSPSLPLPAAGGKRCTPRQLRRRCQSTESGQSMEPGEEFRRGIRRWFGWFRQEKRHGIRWQTALRSAVCSNVTGLHSSLQLTSILASVIASIIASMILVRPLWTPFTLPSFVSDGSGSNPSHCTMGGAGQGGESQGQGGQGFEPEPAQRASNRSQVLHADSCHFHADSRHSDANRVVGPAPGSPMEVLLSN